MEINNLLQPKSLMKCPHPAEVDEKAFEIDDDWNLLKVRPYVALRIRDKALSRSSGADTYQFFKIIGKQNRLCPVRNFNKCARLFVRSVFLN